MSDFNAKEAFKAACTVSGAADRDGRAVCDVCGHHCALSEGQYGRCGARKNEGGDIVCVNYRKVTSLALDPIEKKPLARFYPGSTILSVGSFGCNMTCPFCQNHEIARVVRNDVGEPDIAPGDDTPYRMISPEELSDLAAGLAGKGNIGIAFTYNEPLVGWEFVRDTARLSCGRGMKNVMVTNGFADISVLEELLPYIDAMNIDLKGFSGEYYRKLGGDLETVKRFIVRAAQDCHVELTTLIVPGENDQEEMMDEEARWIASVDKDITLHVTRFFPRYRMTDRDATDVEKVYRLRDVAADHLRHVYTGNC